MEPTRLPRPWDSPGKNTGGGCHFLLQGMKVRSESEVAQSCLTLCDPIDGSPPGSPVPGFSRQEYWSGLPFPSPRDLPDPGIKPRSPTLQVDSLLSELPGKPKNTEVGSLCLLQKSFQLRNRTGVSCSAGEFFTSCVDLDKLLSLSHLLYPSF